jgi:hypothetical protein
VTTADSMLYAFKVGLLAFDATRLCAADVDFPMDVLLYSRGSFELVEQRLPGGRPARNLQLVAGPHAAQRAGPAVGVGGGGFFPAYRLVDGALNPRSFSSVHDANLRPTLDAIRLRKPGLPRTANHPAAPAR